MPIYGVPSASIILKSSGVAVAVTGTLTETALATITIPANQLGLNGSLRIVADGSWPSNANNKSLRIKYNGAAGNVIAQIDTTTTTQGHLEAQIQNANATNAQICHGQYNFPAAVGANGDATLAIDTTAATSVVITGTLANIGDTITLRNYSVQFVPGV